MPSEQSTQQEAGRTLINHTEDEMSTNEIDIELQKAAHEYINEIARQGESQNAAEARLRKLDDELTVLEWALPYGGSERDRVARARVVVGTLLSARVFDPAGASHAA